MGDDTKTGRSGKVKFFKIDTSGDIQAAIPKTRDGAKEPTRLEGTATDLGIAPREDTEKFLLDREQAEDGFVAKQLGRLKAKMDDIAKIPATESLSQGQVDVLRKYIELREFEARDLRDQVKQYREYLKKVSAQFDEAIRLNRELVEKNEILKRERERAQAEAETLGERVKKEAEALRAEYESRMRASGGIEHQMKGLEHEREEWKEKVKADLKRIKLKEKELENKYELLKRDAQALLDSKDKHVLELKKSVDRVELELENAEEKLRANAAVLGAIDSKKRRLIETMRLAITLLEDIDRDPAKDPAAPAEKKEKKKAG